MSKFEIKLNVPVVEATLCCPVQKPNQVNAKDQHNPPHLPTHAPTFMPDHITLSNVFTWVSPQNYIEITLLICTSTAVGDVISHISLTVNAHLNA